MGGTGSGRRPAPIEQRRLKGTRPGRDSGDRKLPDPDNLVSLPGTAGVAPQRPTSIPDGSPGAARWERIWRDAGAWLSPGTDWHILVRLCEAENMREGMRQELAERGFWMRGSMGQDIVNPLVDKMRQQDAEILKYEIQCGLTPSARGALGVGEVKQGDTGGILGDILRDAAGRRTGT